MLNVKTDVIEKYINGRKCAILGLGVSNAPLAEYLVEKGISVSVYDKSSVEALGEMGRYLLARGVDFHTAGENFSDIDGDIIFRSPGIRPDREGILRARERGAELASEIELTLNLTPARTFAITGSDGKTTSTTLTGKFLEKYSEMLGGKTYVGGNIGTPLLTKCPCMTEDDFVVLELSSFQLMTVSHSPENVAITNVSPNHLDWHYGMDEYIAAKKNIIGKQTRRIVTNRECAITLDIANEKSNKDMEIVLFSSSKCSFEEIFDGVSVNGTAIAIYEKEGCIIVDNGNVKTVALELSDIKIPGRHNIENYMTAIGLTYSYVPTEIYAEVARSFFGVEHRLELVRNFEGVDYYNSSIDSSPTRTAAALSALADRKIVLICGGYDKKIPYSPLAKSICEHGGVRVVCLTGATGRKIEMEISEYISKCGAENAIDVSYRESFEEAVLLARQSAKQGDCVLLSPASASFDHFKNFAERGNIFKDIVNSWQ